MEKKTWTEKYSPRTLDDFIIADILRDKLNSILKTKDIGNLIFYGFTGTGKTSVIKYLAKEIYDKYYKQCVLEINAADNRGLDYINNHILNFCKKTLCLNTPAKKLIIFDEADNITIKAQNELIHIIEKYYFKINFVFTCNQYYKIIESIQSRCIIYKFDLISEKNIMQRLVSICQKENLKYTNNALKCITKHSNGDIRQAINWLETIYFSYDEITLEQVKMLCIYYYYPLIDQIILACLNKDFVKILKTFHQLKNNGFCHVDILLMLINRLKADESIDTLIKISLINIIQEYYIAATTEGCDSIIQCYACLSHMVLSMSDQSPVNGLFTM
ncbi:putative replication factor C small subunit [Namao virus]|nr:putative replication factor C small subunit [Namao virus]